MNLQELARQHGKTLLEIGLPEGTAYPVSAGTCRAGARTINRIATTLGIHPTVASAACDESWQQGNKAKAQVHSSDHTASVAS